MKQPAAKIRNFVIISHVDHGKSTLADRFLEVTGTVEARRMRPQYLDRLELERERGITIKMAPVRMKYVLDSEEYILNLIDTPGHSDFAYEVSRALAAVEGAILLVDATKGIQAQTLANFRAAKEAGLKIIGAVNKIDLRPEGIDKVVESLAELLAVAPDKIHRLSGKTGEGVNNLLAAVIREIPPPRFLPSFLTKALIFDSWYDEHKGILVYVRVLSGNDGSVFEAGEEVFFVSSGGRCRLKEVGYFAPEFEVAEKLAGGEIGYLATGLREPSQIKIGDTIIAVGAKDKLEATEDLPLPGYREPRPVVFVSFYPDGGTKFEDLKSALEKLRLTDAALSLEVDKNEALGRGIKVGFLGQLHFEVTASRLRREFGLEFLTTFPSLVYRVKEKGKWREIKDAHDFPDSPEVVLQPMIRVDILTPPAFLGSVLGLKNTFALEVEEIKNTAGSVLVRGRMPLGELIRNFDDQLKSVSAGYASMSYVLAADVPADIRKLEVLVAGEVVPALTRLVPASDVAREARLVVERLKELLPRQQFAQALQARVGGKIVAREDIPAWRKDVTGYLYGGDRSRKMKLWQKQKRGKEKLKSRGRVNIPLEVFRELLKK